MEFDFNKTYGYLKPIAYSKERIGNRPTIICECLRCGKKNVLVQRKNLVSGHTQSCGCYHPNEKNLVNQTFGNLKVIEKTEDRAPNGCIIWKCKCTCEEICFVDTATLTSKRKTSCNCRQKRNGYDSYFNKNVLESYQEGDACTNISLIRSRKPSKQNKLRIKGVYYNKQTGKYIAQIGFMNKRYHLGSYDTPEEAKDAYDEAKERIHMDFIQWYDETHKKI